MYCKVVGRQVVGRQVVGKQVVGKVGRLEAEMGKRKRDVGVNY